MKKKSGTDWKRLETMTDAEIDLSDSPELTEEWFRTAKWHPGVKTTMTIRIDSDVLEWFRATGPGYQTRINKLLRQFMEAHKKRPGR